jgi:hypothetical protein
MFFKWFMTMHWISYVNKPTSAHNDTKIYYNQQSLLHVSATYCGHLQGGVLWRNITLNAKTVYKYKMLSFRLKV